MRRVVAVAAILLTALVAGCTGDPSTNSDEDQVPESIQDVEVTSTTGAIRGVVVTEAVVPIAGVLVALTDGTNRTTDDEGGFVFNGLEPGDYFMTATKKGFLPQQASATVVAGDEEPPVTKITLPQLATADPYTTQQVWDGFIQCAFMAGDGFVGAQLCGPLDERFIHYFSMDRIPDLAQAEGTWDSTQTLAADMALEYYDGGTWHHKVVTGTSPLLISGNATEITDWWGENETELPMRMWPGNGAVALTVNQQFTVYMTMFYNFLPREGWSFIVDGPCNTPDQCS